MWATLVRKGTLVFGLMLAFGLVILVALILPKMFAFAFAKFIFTFGGVREECKRGITPRTQVVDACLGSTPAQKKTGGKRGLLGAGVGALEADSSGECSP